MKVIAYTRVSTDGQVGEDKFGLEAQREQITAYCEKEGHEIIRWVSDEGESGAKYRPGFDEIIYSDTVSNPPVEAVVVAKSDRVARDINVYYYYKASLLRKNIKLISIAENFGEFGVFANMLESFVLCMAEMERSNIAKRTAGGRKIKAAKGGYSGGRAPMGYMIRGGEMQINEEEAKVVRAVFELRESGLTLTSITEELNDSGYKTRFGNKFCISTVQSILNNRKTYEGWYKYGDGDWVKGRHEAILGV